MSKNVIAFDTYDNINICYEKKKQSQTVNKTALEGERGMQIK